LKNITNKKGNMTFNMVNMIPRLIFLVIVLLSVVLLISVFLNIIVDVNYQEADLMSLNLIYSPQGISYFDPNLNRVIPGVIDKEEFMSNKIETRLNNSFSYGEKNKHIAAQIKLIESKNLLTLTPTKTIFYNSEDGKTYGYAFWEPLVEMRGKGAPYYLMRSFPVRLREEINDKIVFSEALIVIEVLIKSK